MNGLVTSSGQVVMVLDEVVALPRQTAALMPGASVVDLPHGMAQLVDSLTGERFAPFANRRIAEETCNFLGGKAT